jgi:hypothetical protein
LLCDATGNDAIFTDIVVLLLVLTPIVALNQSTKYNGDANAVSIQYVPAY